MQGIDTEEIRPVFDQGLRRYLIIYWVFILCRNGLSVSNLVRFY